MVVINRELNLNQTHRMWLLALIILHEKEKHVRVQMYTKQIKEKFSTHIYTKPKGNETIQKRN